jgi:hypothetical protein
LVSSGGFSFWAFLLIVLPEIAEPIAPVAGNDRHGYSKNHIISTKVSQEIAPLVATSNWHR